MSTRLGINPSRISAGSGQRVSHVSGVGSWSFGAQRRIGTPNVHDAGALLAASASQIEVSRAAFVPMCVKVHGSTPRSASPVIQFAMAKTVPSRLTASKQPLTEAAMGYKRWEIRLLLSSKHRQAG